MRGGLNEVVEVVLEGVEYAQGVLESFRLLPESMGFFRVRMTNCFSVPILDLAFDLRDEVFVEMRIKVHSASFHTPTERNVPSFAVALNCGIGSSSLKADVKAFERLHMVRG